MLFVLKEQTVQLRKMQQNYHNRVISVSIPSTFARKLDLVAGEWLSLEFMDNENDSWIKLQPLRIRNSQANLTRELEEVRALSKSRVQEGITA